MIVYQQDQFEWVHIANYKISYQQDQLEWLDLANCFILDLHSPLQQSFWDLGQCTSLSNCWNNFLCLLHIFFLFLPQQVWNKSLNKEMCWFYFSFVINVFQRCLVDWYLILLTLPTLKFSPKTKIKNILNKQNL